MKANSTIFLTLAALLLTACFATLYWLSQHGFGQTLPARGTNPVITTP